MRRKRSLIVPLVLALVVALLPPRHVARANFYTVQNTLDSGKGSLRQAITDANDRSGPDTIDFDIEGCKDSKCTIQPLSALPALTDDGTTIDGTTQPLAAVVINGESAGTSSNGFRIQSANNVIKGLGIEKFGANGVDIDGSGATGNTVSGNYIMDNLQYGVYIHGTAQDNTIGGDTSAERNYILGNDWSGIFISGTGPAGNTVCGNYIGTTGTSDAGNGWSGVHIAAAQNNTIGPDNVISGNDQCGVFINGSGTTGNTVSGNYIGTKSSGTASLGNTYEGIEIADGAQDNTIGPDNVISGNDFSGVRIEDSGTTGNTVSGNYIGTSATGTASLGNGGNGVFITDGAQTNTVGPDNVISANDDGVLINGSGTTLNTVYGNYIGTDASGTASLGNTNGAKIIGGAQNNTVGPDNVISGNDHHGVGISSSGTTGNTVSGNCIGTNASCTGDLGNGWAGVYIEIGAQTNTVGPGNVIAHSGWDGVVVHGLGTTGNTITQNSIHSNTGLGIYLIDGNGNLSPPTVDTANGSLIGGTAGSGDTVEIFTGPDEEGKTYLTTTTAGGGGGWSASGSFTLDDFVTATATDSSGNTSEFSEGLCLLCYHAYVPLVLRNY